MPRLAYETMATPRRIRARGRGRWQPRSPSGGRWPPPAVWCPVLLAMLATGVAARSYPAQARAPSVVEAPTPDQAPTADEVLTVDEALEDRAGDFVPDRLGAPVRLRGVASTRMYETRKDLHYAVVQGDREGVRLVTSDADVLARVRPGTRVEATGVVATYRGAEELHLTDLRIVGHGLPPRPTTVLVAEALGESHSHLLVRIEGRLETVEVADGGLRHTLVDRTGQIPVRLPARLLADPGFVERVRRGGPIEVTGIAGQADDDPPYDAGYRLAPREPEDLAFVPLPPVREILLGALILLVAAAIVLLVLRRRAAEDRARELARLSRRLERSRSALEASERRYRRLFEEDLTAKFVADHEGRILYCNDAFARMLGLPSAVAVSDRGVTLADAATDGGDLLAEVRRKGELAMREVRLPRADGETVIALANLSVDTSQDGAVETVRGSLFDITERRALERQLLHAQKMEAVGRLAGGVAHDLNNMLTTVIGHATLLVESNEEVAEEAGYIGQAAERAARLTRQLLAFSRQQVVEAVTLDLNDVIRGMSTMLRRLLPADIELVTLLDDQIEPVRGDPGQLEQVVLNLVVNARDAMPDGGRIVIRTAPGRRDRWQDHADAAHCDRCVALRVEDDGTGMTPETRDRALEPFFSTKSEGSGLGLATVYGIITHAGGAIRLDSEPGSGTTVEIRLPHADVQPEQDTDAQVDPATETHEPGNGTGRHTARARAADTHDPDAGTAAPGTHAPQDPPPGRPAQERTILLVDDESALRRFARKALERSGYNVRECENGEEALRAFRDRPDGYDLVLTDLVMPLMGGRQLAEKLNAIRPEQPVLFMSGYADQADLPELQDSDFLPKPFDSETLRHRVAAALP